MSSLPSPAGAAPAQPHPASDAPTEAGIATGAAETRPSGLIMFLLMAVLMLHVVDRQIFAILAEQIKSDLALSDTQIGLLSGLAFSVLYALIGIPIARIADAGDRPRLMAAATFVWSAMTALCGAATGFGSMLLVRMGVAIGEAGGLPPLHSLIGEIFDARRRAFAFAVVHIGAPIGILIAFVLGGTIAAAAGWRAAFVAAAVPGLLLAAVIWFVLPEPRRRGGGANRSASGFRAAVATLLGNAIYRHLVAGFTLAGFSLYATLVWSPSLMQRSFGWGLEETGAWLGAAFGACGVVSLFSFGAFSDRLAGYLGSTAHSLVCAGMMALAAPFLLAAILSGSGTAAFALLLVPILLVTGWQPAGLSAIQAVVAPDNRGMASAVMLFVFNLVGLGGGPLAVGMISDAVVEQMGDQSLVAGLAIVPLALLWSALHFFRAARLTDRLRPALM